MICSGTWASCLINTESVVKAQLGCEHVYRVLDVYFGPGLDVKKVRRCFPDDRLRYGGDVNAGHHSE